VKEKVKAITDSLGTFIPKYPMDDEKNLKLDYNYEKAIIADLEEMDFDAPRWIPKFNFAKVVKVYDGDTIHIIAKPLNGDGEIYKFTVRLRGIDTPEMGTKKAEEAKDYLTKLILNKVVKVKDIGIDKYGRILAEIWVNAENVTDLLLNAKLGYGYYGGKKKEIAE